METQIANFYCSVNPRDHYMRPYQLLHRNRAESGLMVSLGLWDISLQERQECVCVGRSGSDVAGVGSGGGRSGNGLGRVILGEFRCEVGGKDGGLGWSRSGELFYGTDVVIGSLRRGTRSRMSAEVGDR